MLVLKSIRLTNFRKYVDERIHFDPRINFIKGRNAVGKTTLLEAVHLLMTGTTFRSSQLPDLIRHGEQQFRVEAHFVKHGIEQVLTYYFDGSERKIFLNKTSCPSSGHLLGVLQGVIAHPDNIGMIKGAPGIRRQYIDVQLAQADPLYVHFLTRYNKAMRQRNVLLKSKQGNACEPWEHEMAQAASYLTLKREETITQLDLLAKSLYERLCCQGHRLSLKYATSAPAKSPESNLKAYFMSTFAKNRRRELDFGTTLSGPHKDDLHIFIEERDARYYASEGQQRSCIMAMKLAEWQQLKDKIGAAPLMLIDDVGQSLDVGRRTLLMEYLQELQQVLVTGTADADLSSRAYYRIDIDCYSGS